MTSLAKAAERGTRKLTLLHIDGDQVDMGAGDDLVEIAQPLRSVPRLDDNRALHKTRDRHSNRVRILDCLQETTPLLFALQDCQNCGGIDHHQRGNPISSYPRISSARRESSTGKLAQCCAISSSSSASRRLVRS